jgi:nucleotide-binding universal stress UspA family protein
MFQRVVAAYNHSPQAERALLSAIRLAKILNSELHAITVLADLPAYAAYAAAGDISLPQSLKGDREKVYEALQEKAQALARQHGVELRTHLIEGHGVEVVIDFLRKQKAELLVIGLHPNDLYLARLWSTVYELATDAPCSVLGVH